MLLNPPESIVGGDAPTDGQLLQYDADSGLYVPTDAIEDLKAIVAGRKTLVQHRSGAIAAGTPANGTDGYVFTSAGLAAPATAGSFSAIFRLDPADMPDMDGYEKKLRIRGFVVPNEGTAPGTTFTYGLRAATPDGNNANPGVEVGAAPTDGTTPSTGAITVDTFAPAEVELDFPVAGYYVMNCIPAGSTVANGSHGHIIGLRSFYAAV